MIHRLFFKTRQIQCERTLWNAKHSREATWGIDGTFTQEELPKPKLQSAAEYMKEKINTEYYNLIMSGLLDREKLNYELSN